MAMFQFGVLALFYLGAFIDNGEFIPAISSWQMEEEDDRRVVFKVKYPLKVQKKYFKKNLDIIHHDPHIKWTIDSLSRLRNLSRLLPPTIKVRHYYKQVFSILR